MDLTELQNELSHVGNLWDGILDPVTMMQDAMKGTSSFSPMDFLLSFLGEVLRQIGGSAAVILTLVGISYFSVFIFSLGKQEGETWKDTAVLATLAILGIPMIAQLGDILIETQNALADMEAVMLTSIPTLGALSLNPSSPVFMVIAQGTAFLLRHVFLPLALINGALGICDVLSPKFSLSGIKGMVKSGFSWGLGITMTLFGGATALTGALGSSAATLGKRAARYAAGAMIPVVGIYLAEATETVFSGAGIIKNAAGTGVVAALLVVCMGPFTRLLAVSILYRLAAVLVGPVAEDRVNKLFAAVIETLTMLTGLVALLGVMYFINLAAIMSAV